MRGRHDLLTGGLSHADKGLGRKSCVKSSQFTNAVLQSAFVFRY
jgi:hypothetical protein